MCSTFSQQKGQLYAVYLQAAFHPAVMVFNSPPFKDDATIDCLAHAQLRA